MAIRMLERPGSLSVNKWNQEYENNLRYKKISIRFKKDSNLKNKPPSILDQNKHYLSVDASKDSLTLPSINTRSQGVLRNLSAKKELSNSPKRKIMGKLE